MARVASVWGALGDARLSAWISITRHLRQERRGVEERRRGKLRRGGDREEMIERNKIKGRDKKSEDG